MSAASAVSPTPHSNSTDAMHTVNSTMPVLTANTMEEELPEVPEEDLHDMLIFFAKRNEFTKLQSIVSAYGLTHMLDARENETNATPLHFFAHHGNVLGVELVLSCGLSVDVRDVAGCTPFFLACRSGHIETAQLLLAHGADIEARMTNNQTPLLAAAQSHHLLLSLYLLDLGADHNAVDNTGGTVTHTAAQAGNVALLRHLWKRRLISRDYDFAGMTALHKAILFKRCDVVHFLITTARFDPQQRTNGATIPDSFTSHSTDPEIETKQEEAQTTVQMGESMPEAPIKKSANDGPRPLNAFQLVALLRAEPIEPGSKEYWDINAIDLAVHDAGIAFDKKKAAERSSFVRLQQKAHDLTQMYSVHGVWIFAVLATGYTWYTVLLPFGFDMPILQHILLIGAFGTIISLFMAQYRARSANVGPRGPTQTFCGPSASFDWHSVPTAIQLANTGSRDKHSASLIDIKSAVASLMKSRSANQSNDDIEQGTNAENERINLLSPELTQRQDVPLSTLLFTTVHSEVSLETGDTRLNEETVTNRLQRLLSRVAVSPSTSRAHTSGETTKQENGTSSLIEITSSTSADSFRLEVTKRNNANKAQARAAAAAQLFTVARILTHSHAASTLIVNPAQQLSMYVPDETIDLVAPSAVLQNDYALSDAASKLLMRPLSHIERLVLDTLPLRSTKVRENVICYTSECIKELRSKHDSMTDRRYNRFDHFCGWLACVICEVNHIYFLSFLGFHLLCNIGWLGLLIYRIWDTWGECDGFFCMLWDLCYARGSLLLPIALLLHMLAIVVCSSLFYFHFEHAVCLNETTNELLNQDRYKHFEAYQIVRPPGDAVLLEQLPSMGPVVEPIMDQYIQQDSRLIRAYINPFAFSKKLYNLRTFFGRKPPIRVSAVANALRQLRVDDLAKRWKDRTVALKKEDNTPEKESCANCQHSEGLPSQLHQLREFVRSRGAAHAPSVLSHGTLHDGTDTPSSPAIPEPAIEPSSYETSVSQAAGALA